MSVVVGTLVTMALQAGVSIYNQCYSRKNLEAINRRKQEFKASSQTDSLKRDYEKFKRSCELQLQIEEDGHVERLNKIDQELIGSFSKIAHTESLKSHYPLKISPYIISKSVIPICGTQIGHSRQEVFCILTNSNDSVFNQKILPTLDEMLYLLYGTNKVCIPFVTIPIFGKRSIFSAMKILITLKQSLLPRQLPLLPILR